MINIFDVKRAESKIEDKITAAINGVRSTGAYCRNFNGVTKEFEQAFAEYCGNKYAVAVNSGSDALMFSLLACGIRPGYQVATVSHSFFESAAVISKIGATPRFIDINPNTFNMDTIELEKELDANKEIKAILPVHLYGQSADLGRIQSIASKRGIPIIEDACEAHGVKYASKRVPISTAGCFSFYPTKNLGGIGDGGIVVTDNANIAEKIRRLRDDGRNKEFVYLHDEIGYNSRMDAINAAVLLAKLPYLEVWNAERKDIAARYNKNLVEVVEIPKISDNADHVYYLYVIKVQKGQKLRDELGDFLKAGGIGTAVHFPIPIHMQPPYRSLNYKGKLPVTEELAGRILSLPIYPGLTTNEIDKVCSEIKGFLRK